MLEREKIFIFFMNKAAHAQKEKYPCESCAAAQNQPRSTALPRAPEESSQSQSRGGSQTFAIEDVASLVFGVWAEFYGFAIVPFAASLGFLSPRTK